MKSVLLSAASVSAIIILAAGATAQPRAGSGTTTYWMSAETMSGFAAAMGQQGGAGNIVGAMLGGRGGAGNPSFVRNLTLQLGSPQRPSGAPEAAHLPPAALGAGASLPLVTPRGAPPAPPSPHQMPQMGQAQGRILIYWGCGERARPGQPVEIDLARMSRGEMPAAMAALNLNYMTPPSASTSTTYGEWPNDRSRTQVPPTGSLVGDHVVRGNYSPEIRFTLAQGQDFLAPVNVTSNTASASGAVPVAWQAVPNARAYFVMATGAREDNTIVMWSSSEVQAMQMAFDYLAPEEVARLVQQRVLLNPQTTQCTVPAEVAGSVQAASLMINAFGPEANFSHPARPANAPRNWAPEWTVKLRTRSTHMGMLGMDMAAMMGDARSSDDQPRPERRRRRNPLERILGQ